MIPSLVFDIGLVAAMFTVAYRTLAVRRDIPKNVSTRHYVFISFFIVMNFSGLRQVNWTLRRLLDGDLVASLNQHYIALNELTPIGAVVVWTYSVLGPSIMALLTYGMARSSRRCRVLMLRLFPVLVLAGCVASSIDIRGAAEMGRGHGRGTEYVFAFCLWCLLSWPYVFAYRFYRDAQSDILFTDSDIVPAAIDEGTA